MAAAAFAPPRIPANWRGARPHPPCLRRAMPRALASGPPVATLPPRPPYRASRSNREPAPPARGPQRALAALVASAALACARALV